MFQYRVGLRIPGTKTVRFCVNEKKFMIVDDISALFAINLLIPCSTWN
jgi:hypothetical protein